jgi:hypothetical protein
MSVIPTYAQNTESPSSLRLSIFMVGQDSRGNWVALEKSGARGGLFTNRAEAFKFVKFENGNRLHAVVWVNEIVEFNTSPAHMAPSEERLADSTQRARRAA